MAALGPSECQPDLITRTSLLRGVQMNYLTPSSVCFGPPWADTLTRARIQRWKEGPRTEGRKDRQHGITCPLLPKYPEQDWVRAAFFGSTGHLWAGQVHLPEDLCQLGKQSPGHFRAPALVTRGPCTWLFYSLCVVDAKAAPLIAPPQGCLSLSEEQAGEGQIFQITKKSQGPG